MESVIKIELKIQGMPSSIYFTLHCKLEEKTRDLELGNIVPIQTVFETKQFSFQLDYTFCTALSVGCAAGNISILL